MSPTARMSRITVAACDILARVSFETRSAARLRAEMRSWRPGARDTAHESSRTAGAGCGRSGGIAQANLPRQGWAGRMRCAPEAGSRQGTGTPLPAGRRRQRRQP